MSSEVTIFAKNTRTKVTHEASPEPDDVIDNQEAFLKSMRGKLTCCGRRIADHFELVHEVRNWTEKCRVCFKGRRDPMCLTCPQRWNSYVTRSDERSEAECVFLSMTSVQCAAAFFELFGNVPRAMCAATMCGLQQCAGSWQCAKACKVQFEQHLMQKDCNVPYMSTVVLDFFRTCHVTFLHALS